jgi:hypothetical protein
VEFGVPRVWLRLTFHLRGDGGYDLRVESVGGPPQPVAAGQAPRVEMTVSGPVGILRVRVPDGFAEHVRGLLGRLDTRRQWAPSDALPVLAVFVIPPAGLEALDWVLSTKSLLPTDVAPRAMVVIEPSGRRLPRLPDFELPLDLLLVGEDGRIALDSLTVSSSWFRVDTARVATPIWIADAAGVQRLRGRRFDVVVAGRNDLIGLDDAGIRTRLLVLVGDQEASRPLAAATSISWARSVVALDAASHAVTDLLEGFAHDLPLHEAVATIQPRPAVLSTPDAVHDLRLLPLLESVTVDAYDLETMLSTDTTGMTEIGQRLMQVHFAQESLGLFPLAALRATLRELRSLAGAPAVVAEPTERVLDAALRRGPDVLAASPQFYVEGMTTLQAGGHYLLDVRIGQRSSRSIVRGEQPAIDPLLPDSRHGHDLEFVVFPGAFEVVGSRRRPLHLPPSGPSDLIEVELVAPRTPGTYALRYGIYHLGNLIQTYRLRAEVTLEESWRDEEVVLAELDFTATSSWTNIDELQRRSLSLVVNAGADGTHHLYAVADATAFDWDLSPTLQADLAEPLRAALDTHIRRKARDAEAALREVALAGSELWGGLFDRTTSATTERSRVGQVAARDAMRRIRDASDLTLQINRVDAHQALPWSLVYDWSVPDRDGPVCWGTEGGDDICGHGPDDEVVCVRGFWGVRHRLEERVDSGRDVVTALRGADTRVDLALGVRNSYTEGLRSDLTPLAKTYLLAKKDVLLNRLWDRTTRPQVLAVVGHFDEEEGSIECGTSEQRLTARMITRRAARTADWDDPTPLVLLLGCDSGRVTPDHVTSHLLAFVGVGAAALVVTESVVRTSDVRSFASAFLTAMLASDGSSASMAAALQQVRASLLAKQNLFAVLAFSAFGSADLHVEA